MTHREVYIVRGLRSPFAKIDRELSALDALRLSVPVVQQTVVGASGVGPGRSGEVDLAIWGAVVPSLSVSNWGREVWLDAELDSRVPALTVIQQCATSLAAATLAAGQVRTGRVELALCGGVESMSHTQVGLSTGLSRAIRRAGTARGPRDAARHVLGLRPRHIGLAVPSITERTTGKSMGQHTEQMAAEWDIAREDQDAYAAESHGRAVAAVADGFYRSLLVSAGTYAADADTIPRADTTTERLAGLRPAFDRKRGTLTAGNSSTLTDGAAACWVASGEGVRRLPAGVPRARLVDWEQAAIDPRRDGLLIAPAIAIPRMLARHGLTYADVDLWEIHEAFAAQVLATLRALEDERWLADSAGVKESLGPFPRERINPNGGSLALGHPFAATGARILSQAVTELASMPAGSRCVVSVCAAGGLGHVALLAAEG